MKYPKITIVTPTFNQGAYIEQTIQSVLEQQYPNLAYFIIDGGSTDETLQIIKKYERHLSGWVSEPDRGQSHAINKGLQRASGDVFNWLNSDDYLAAGALHAIGDAFRDPATQVFCGRMRMFWEDTGREAVWTPTRVSPSLSKMIGFSSNRQPATWFRLSGLRRIGALCESLHYTMDQDMWVRYLLKNGNRGMVQSDALMVHFRRHGASKTQSSTAEFSRDLMSIFHSLAVQAGLGDHAAKLKEAFGMEPLTGYTLALNIPPGKALARKALDYFFLRMAEMKLGNGDAAAAGRFLHAVRLSSLSLRDMRYRLILRKRLRSR